MEKPLDIQHMTECVKLSYNVLYHERSTDRTRRELRLLKTVTKTGFLVFVVELDERGLPLEIYCYPSCSVCTDVALKRNPEDRTPPLHDCLIKNLHEGEIEHILK